MDAHLTTGGSMLRIGLVRQVAVAACADAGEQVADCEQPEQAPTVAGH